MSGERAARWIVSGRVQGVGFRWFVRRRAVELHVVGWAENLPDGRVEVVARGSGEALDSLDRSLRRVPVMAVVENVEMSAIPREDVDLNFFDTR